MTSFAFANTQTGLGVSQTGVYRTADGGVSFSPVVAGVASAVTFLSPTVAVAIVDGAFVRSTNAGLTWTPGSNADSRKRLFVVSSDVLLAWGRGGSFPDYDDRIFRSTDAGQTWADLGEAIPMDASEATQTFTTPAASVIVASDASGNLFRSTDAGLTWSQTYATPGPRPGFLGSGAPDFFGATGYIGMSAGFVARTSDAGASWTQISSGSGLTVNAMDRFANGDLIAVGDAGQVLLRQANASTWQLRTSLGPDSLVAVQVVGAQAVVAVSASGILYRSADAGATWVAAASAPATSGRRRFIFQHFVRRLGGARVFQGAAFLHRRRRNHLEPVTDFQEPT